MKNLMRYMHGGIIGICCEYLYRVEYSIFPLVIMIATIALMLLDVTTKEK
jgi:uncharacterized membrane protein (Fun14 family)